MGGGFAEKRPAVVRVSRDETFFSGLGGGGLAIERSDGLRRAF
jgi:hypothetical protein